MARVSAPPLRDLRNAIHALPEGSARTELRDLLRQAAEARETRLRIAATRPPPTRWTIVGVLFAIYAASAISILMAAVVPHALVLGLFGAPTAAAVIAWATAILFSYAGVGIAATAQAIIFRRLTGWRPGHALQPPKAD